MAFRRKLGRGRPNDVLLRLNYGRGRPNHVWLQPSTRRSRSNVGRVRPIWGWLDQITGGFEQIRGGSGQACDRLGCVLDLGQPWGPRATNESRNLVDFGAALRGIVNNWTSDVFARTQKIGRVSVSDQVRQIVLSSGPGLGRAQPNLMWLGPSAGRAPPNQARGSVLDRGGSRPKAARARQSVVRFREKMRRVLEAISTGGRAGSTKVGAGSEQE